jgi:alpha-galactosidase
MSIHRVRQVYLAVIFLFLGAGGWRQLRAQDAGVALTHPMGWNSWNHFNHNIEDKTVRAQADAMVSSGMRDARYTYINVEENRTPR